MAKKYKDGGFFSKITVIGFPSYAWSVPLALGGDSLFHPSKKVRQQGRNLQSMDLVMS